MSLNIKNDEACRLADDLAQMTGETKTGAITVALRERIERERRRRGADARLREMRAIAKRCSRLMGPGTPSIDHGDMLYDERGFAKMIVDSSAILAILNCEPDAELYDEKISLGKL